MMECKKALTECNGDIEKATNWLRERGIAKAVSKAERETKEGIIFSHITPTFKVGAMIEVNCETDFVAKNEDFRNLCLSLANHVIEKSPADVNQMLEQKFYNDPEKSVSDLIAVNIAKIGENIQISRFSRLELDKPGRIYSYVHTNDKLGVLVTISTETDNIIKNETFEVLCKDIAMHITANSPLAITPDEIDPKLVENEREVYRNKALNDGKPEAVVDKIVDGQIKKLYKENCLLQQEFVKDATKTVQDVINETMVAVGEKINVVKFVRFVLGE
jgi:elongation factor Ts